MKKTKKNVNVQDSESKMVLVEGGHMPTAPEEPFFMKVRRNLLGSGADIGARPLPPEQVESFLIGMHCVRSSEWLIVLDWARQNNFEINSGEAETPNHPITNINFYDAIKWCNAKSMFLGHEPVYWLKNRAIYCRKEKFEGLALNKIQINSQANGYRLPTEYEWQWAAMGGKSSRGFLFSGANDLDKVGWFEKNSGGVSHPVGLKMPNELGLFDMSGNMEEWCWTYPEQEFYDSESEYYSARTRGGAWALPDYCCKTGHRSNGTNPGAIEKIYSLRLAVNKPDQY